MASIPIDINGFYFYNPLLPGSALAIFQVHVYVQFNYCIFNCTHTDTSNVMYYYNVMTVFFF